MGQNTEDIDESQVEADRLVLSSKYGREAALIGKSRHYYTDAGN